MAIKKYFHYFNQNQLLKGSFILFIGTFAGGVLNYVFNTLMGRMLGPQDYGAFSSLISLVYIIAVPAGTLSLIVAKKVAGYQAKGEMGTARFFIKYITKKSLIIGALVFLVFLALTPITKEFLRIDSFWPFLILAVDFFVVFVSSVPSGGLRGQEKFFDISWTGILAIIIKTISAVLLVMSGLSMIGAVIALLIADALIIGILFLKNRIKEKEETAQIIGRKLVSFAIPVFIASLCMAMIYNIDVILAKHFLDAHSAGYYAVLSLLGKIILFGTSAVGIVIFPLTAKNHELGLSNKRILSAAMALTILGAGLITAIYFLFPHFIVHTLFGDSYLEIVPFVGLMGIVFIFYSLINLLVSYALSCAKTGITYILVFGAVLQIFLLTVFHCGILAIIYDMIVVMGITLGGLVIYLILGKKKNG